MAVAAASLEMEEEEEAKEDFVRAFVAMSSLVCLMTVIQFHSNLEVRQVLKMGYVSYST